MSFVYGGSSATTPLQLNQAIFIFKFKNLKRKLQKKKMEELLDGAGCQISIMRMPWIAFGEKIKSLIAKKRKENISELYPCSLKVI